MGLIRSMLARLGGRSAIRHQQLAMVALTEPRVPDAEALFRRSTEAWSDLPSIADIRTEGPLISASLGGGGVAAFAAMPIPIPAQDVDAACELSWYWPGAREALAAHKSHTIIHVAGSLAPVATSLLLTRLVASFAEETGAIAVYWGNAGLVHEMSMFGEQAKAASLDSPPVLLWIGFAVGTDHQGRRFLQTIGMPQYDLMNIEVPLDGRDFNGAYELAGDVATYLLTAGPVINDGDTLGRTEIDRTRVLHRDSALDPTSRVYVVQVEPHA
jgi:hypothetical protein